METTEKIVEAYCRYIKGWATIPNLKCAGQYEIDLLAIDLNSLDRYHIEAGVSISGAHSGLTAKPFSPDALKERTKEAAQRRTLGYFVDRKFGLPEVMQTVRKYGFEPGKYQKVIVTWGWEDEAKSQADQQGIVLWDFRDLMREIGKTFEKDRTYFIDDTLRTLQLFGRAAKS